MSNQIRFLISPTVEDGEKLLNGEAITLPDESTLTMGTNDLLFVPDEESDDPTTGTQGPQGPQGEPGEDGLTPYIGGNGNWWIGDTDTGVSAQGPQGIQGEKGEQGIQGEQGEKGEQGDTGRGIASITTDDNGNLVIRYTDGASQTVNFSGSAPATVAEASFRLVTETYEEFSIFGDDSYTVGRESNGDVSFTWANQGVKITSPNIVDINAFKDNEIKSFEQGHEITIYPYTDIFGTADLTQSDSTWSYALELPTLTTSATITYVDNDGGRKTIGPSGGRWVWPPYTVTLKYTGTIEIVDGDGHIVRANDANFVHGVNIKIN